MIKLANTKTQKREGEKERVGRQNEREVREEGKKRKKEIKERERVNRGWWLKNSIVAWSTVVTWSTEESNTRGAASES